MLKSNLPPAAVRQRMVVDRIEPAVIDAFFTGGASIAVQNEEDLSPKSSSSHADYGKYKKMLKVGMTEDVVQQKMETAGIGLEDINNFFIHLIEENRSSLTI